jgi:chorismate mutase
VPAFCLARQLEDLRQRLAVLRQLPPERDGEYETLIKMRAHLMEQIAKYMSHGRPML